MLYAIVAVIILILDQGLKYWVSANLELNTGIRELVPKLVHLTHIHNEGAAFGFLKDADFARWLFLGVTLAFVILVVILIATKAIRGGFGRWMALIVMAGAIGNGIDRLIHSYVVDMLEVEFISFPVFNIADICITVGGILFCLYVIFHKNPEEDVDPRAAREKDVRLARARYKQAQGGANIDEIVRTESGAVRANPAAKEPQRRRPQQRPVTELSAVNTPEQEEELARRREDYARRQRETYRHEPEKPAVEASFEPAPEPTEQESYARWEQAQADKDLPVFTPPEKPEPVPAPEPAPAPAPTRQDDDFEIGEFSLEDILNEFR